MNQNGIVTPHEHDVLSGRGNFVNYHAGNEHFRALVRKHKVAYVACPKPQKGKFSRIIVDEIRSRNPPGRFLKQDQVTKLWYDIGEKKALDKTRQALREGAPEIMKEIGVADDADTGDQLDVSHENSTYGETQARTNQTSKLTQAPVPGEMQPRNTDQMHLPHHGQYVPQPVPIPFDDPSPIVNRSTTSMHVVEQSMMRAPQVSMQQHQHHQQQQHQPQQISMRQTMSNLAPQRIVRNGMGGNSGVVPVRSLAGIRQAMQQQAQRNHAYLQQHYQLTPENLQYGIGGQGVYAGMQQAMLDEFEPRPIGPGNNLLNSEGVKYEKAPVGLDALPGMRRNFQREASDRSINVDKVFGSSSTSKAMDNSAVSIMSLSIGAIVDDISGHEKTHSGDASDPNDLADLFDSSVKLGGSTDRFDGSMKLGTGEKRRKPPGRTGSSDGNDLARVMNMSVMSIGGDVSELGSHSTARMAESNNTISMSAMSFTDVFDSSDH